MPVYVILAKMTDQGRRRFRETVPRLRPIMQQAERLMGQLPGPS